MTKAEELTHILARIDRCGNMAQVCFLLDKIPIWVRKEIDKVNSREEEEKENATY